MRLGGSDVEQDHQLCCVRLAVLWVESVAYVVLDSQVQPKK